ncbi:MAG: threonine--tRNA ligase, partial [bacterium]
TAFFTQEALEAHLARLEEAKKRDHRKLGRALDLFSVQDAAGPGLIFWHPKGATVRMVIEEYLRSTLTANGYQFVITPHVARVGLWQTSGHWDFYRENMFTPMDLEGQAYLVKPMNCPGHILIYQSTRRSYRELPLRLAEFGTVYRYERTGVMHGLMRVRGFTQDDAHIFCQPEQLAEELAGCLALVLEILRTFGFTEFGVFLSTKPDHAVGSDEMWVKAEAALREAVTRAGLSPQVDPGGGVFYGPKIDVTIRDAINRSWQCATIQVDFNLPERFRIEYTGSDGKAHQPIMIHRALLGSFERFLGVLIEHYAGAFPAWLAPVQVVVAPVADGQAPYAREVASAARAKGLRVEVNEDNQPLGAKIRAAQMTKVPVVWVVGKREQEARSVAVRVRNVAEQSVLPFESAIASLAEEVSRRG